MGGSSTSNRFPWLVAGLPWEGGRCARASPLPPSPSPCDLANGEGVLNRQMPNSEGEETPLPSQLTKPATPSLPPVGMYVGWRSRSSKVNVHTTQHTEKAICSSALVPQVIYCPMYSVKPLSTPRAGDAAICIPLGRLVLYRLRNGLALH